MPKQIYIAVGNHKSLVGINEIIYTLYSSLSENLSVKLTRSLKPDAVNIIIDEFASSADLLAIEQTKKLYPKTKIIVVATEFVTPVTLLGVELVRTFNFFGNFRDWRVLVGSTIRSLVGGMPPYMRLRYLGFVRMMKYCDLLVVYTKQFCRQLQNWQPNQRRTFQRRLWSIHELRRYLLYNKIALPICLSDLR